jgi:hypothetical protein
MASGHERFIAQLENAAKRADIMTPSEVATLLRRAALRLRMMSGDDNLDAENALLIDGMSQKPGHMSQRRA